MFSAIGQQAIKLEDFIWMIESVNFLLPAIPNPLESHQHDNLIIGPKPSIRYTHTYTQMTRTAEKVIGIGKNRSIGGHNYSNLD